MYSSFGGVVLCDGGRKQAAASGIGVQWGRQADKSTFTYTGMESTSCHKMTLRYEKNIAQNLSLFLGWILVNDQTNSKALKTKKQGKIFFSPLILEYEKGNFFVWMLPDFARMTFLQQVFLDEVTSGEKPISFYVNLYQKAHVINPGFPRGKAGY